MTNFFDIPERSHVPDIVGKLRAAIDEAMDSYSEWLTPPNRSIAWQRFQLQKMIDLYSEAVVKIMTLELELNSIKTLNKETPVIGGETLNDSIKTTDIVYSTSRYGDKRWIRENADGSYDIFGKSAHIRTFRSSVDGKSVMTMFDFEGGPCIFTGDKICGIDKRIDKMTICDNLEDDMTGVRLIVINAKTSLSALTSHLKKKSVLYQISNGRKEIK